MTDYKETLEIVFDEIKDIEPEVISTNLDDSTGYILAEDIIADTNLPAFDYSTMDGFAVKYNPHIKEWYVIGEITAGNYKEYNIEENLAVSIMTGGKIPNGADTVIPIEDIILEGQNIRLSESAVYNKGLNIRYAGEDMRVNDLAIRKNSILKPHIISLAAACGKNKVNVFRPFRIGIISTGDELLEINEKPTGDKIRNTNIHTLISCIKNINMIPAITARVGDNKEIVKKKLLELLNSDIDILVTSGAVSVGKHDLLPELFESIGARKILWKVNIKPGKPFHFSVYQGKDKFIPIFSLPGNPVSCFVNFEIIVRPVLLKLMGIIENRCFPAILDNTLKKHDGKRHFVLGSYSYDNEKKEIIVKRAGSRSSGDMVTLSRANCLIIFPEKKDILKEGEKVECIRI